MRFTVVRSILAAALVLFLPVGAEAAYDMSGKWLLVPSGVELSRLDLTQVDGVLSEPPPPGWPAGWEGTIDEGTGAFHLSRFVNIPCPPGDWTLEGSVALDGRTFTGTLVQAWLVAAEGASKFECRVFTTPVTGTRCGNNQVDAWEGCDFGDVEDGDCCSSTCELAGSGSTCTSDTNDCTSDTCDAAGNCNHVAAAGPCDEPRGCGTGECSAGTCVVSVPAPAGTSCDLDESVCTVDTCDGAGTCTVGNDLDCLWPCGICDSGQGCIRGGYFGDLICEDSFDNIDLVVKTSAKGRRKVLRLSIDADEVSPFRDPTADTWTFACLYEDDGVVTRPIFSATIPPGGDCGGEPCWQPRDQAYKYTDKTGATDGILSMSVEQYGGFQLKGRGGNLTLPAELSTTSTLIPLIATREDHLFYSTACWSRPVQSERRTATFFRGGS